MPLARTLRFALALGVAQRVATAQSTPTPKKPVAPDTAFAAMQQRGKQAMGFDQYTSTHQFNDLSDGGIIHLVRDVDDSAGVAQIRAHLHDIARAFGTGDFSTPEFVHMQTVPGSKIMAAKRSEIRYSTKDLPRGGELRMTTHDPEALAAIHQFLAFQRTEHRAM